MLSLFVAGAGSWIEDYCPYRCLSDMSIGSRYLSSLYWSVTTMMTVRAPPREGG